MDEFVVQMLKDDLELEREIIQQLSSKKKLKSFEVEDLEYAKKIEKALKEVLKHYGVIKP